MQRVIDKRYDQNRAKRLYSTVKILNFESKLLFRHKIILTRGTTAMLANNIQSGPYILNGQLKINVKKMEITLCHWWTLKIEEKRKNMTKYPLQ